MIWHHKHYCNRDSKNFSYILICNTCEWFYLEQTTKLEQRIGKHKPDVFHPKIVFLKNAQNINVIVAE